MLYDTVISHLVVKFKFQQTKPIPQYKEVLDCLNDLNKRFVVVPIDKTFNDVDIVCKKLCCPKVLREFGIYNDHTQVGLLIQFRSKLLDFH